MTVKYCITSKSPVFTAYTMYFKMLLFKKKKKKGSQNKNLDKIAVLDVTYRTIYRRIGTKKMVK